MKKIILAALLLSGSVQLECMTDKVMAGCGLVGGAGASVYFFLVSYEEWTNSKEPRTIKKAARCLSIACTGLLPLALVFSSAGKLFKGLKN